MRIPLLGRKPLSIPIDLPELGRQAQRLARPELLESLRKTMEQLPRPSGLDLRGRALRLAVLGLSKLLGGAATEDDVRDLVQAISGIVGFSKRRALAGSTQRQILDRADLILDQARRELGEAKT